MVRLNVRSNGTKLAAATSVDFTTLPYYRAAGVGPINNCRDENRPVSLCNGYL